MIVENPAVNYVQRQALAALKDSLKRKKRFRNSKKFRASVMQQTAKRIQHKFLKSFLRSRRRPNIITADHLQKRVTSVLSSISNTTPAFLHINFFTKEPTKYHIMKSE